jgi:ATP-dependent RNA helicase DeaD
MSKTDTNSEDVPPTFEDLALSEAVSRAVRERGYANPTPVQAAVFEPASAGHDCVVQARTGTGKTAAFGLPLVSSRVRANQPHCQALILCPTRELALQVSRELQALATYSGARVVSIYGGAPMAKQIEELQQGAHIVVGTPGRVLDHLKRKTLNVEHLRSFVLDECDEMLSMGFLPQINAIWAHLPSGHQTLLFSATMPKEVTRVADSRLRSPQFITLSGDHVGALEIQHYFYLSHGSKSQELLQLIEYENPDSAIIFCNTKDETKRVAKVLQDQGYATEWLNADLGQNDRERVMKQTRAEELRFLVCTDVAARGIDISHLTHVINFDFPDSSEQYVHRTGRTGRAGKIGTALSLVSPGAIGDLYYLRLKYKIHPIERHLPSREELKAREESEIITNLSQQFTATPFSGVAGQAATPVPGQAFVSLARRLLTHDQAETILAGLLAVQLGSRDAAGQRADASRKLGRPAHRPPAPAASESAPVTRALAPRANGRPADSGRSPRNGSNGSAFAAAPEAIEGSSTLDAASAPRDSVARGGSPRDSAARDTVPRVRPPRRTEQDASRGERPRRHFDEDVGIGYEVAEYDAAPVADGQNGAQRPATETPLPAPTAREPLPVRSDDLPETGEYISLFVNVGKRDGARTEDLEEALDAAGISADDTGRILVRLKHSFVEVKPDAQDRVIEKLGGREICGRVTHVEVARPRSESRSS